MVISITSLPKPTGVKTQENACTVPLHLEVHPNFCTVAGGVTCDTINLQGLGLSKAQGWRQH